MSVENFGLEDIKELLTEAYLPFADIERAIPWPEQPGRLENDAEHSFSLSLVSAAVAAELGLDANKAAAYGTVHDLVEVYSGDTSVWDVAGLDTKANREDAGLERLRGRFAIFPWIAATIDEYKSLESEEARLVYALDKFLAVLMIVQDEGRFWKGQGITFEQHHQKYLQKRQEVAEHPLVLSWYDKIHDQIRSNWRRYFDK